MPSGKHSDETIQIKININGQNIHFARIRRSFWDNLNHAIKDTSFSDRTKWIKEMYEKEFSIKLETKEDLLKFDEIKYDYNYEDKSDWLRDKIRDFIKELY